MMTTMNETPRCKIPSARRLTLLGSVAIVGAALAFGGVATGQLSEQAFAATTQTLAQGPAGFADLIARVKPAVISVRVKMDQTADVSDAPQMNDDEGMPPLRLRERTSRADAAS
jgi:serine protease Do